MGRSQTHYNPFIVDIHVSFNKILLLSHAALYTAYTENVPHLKCDLHTIKRRNTQEINEIIECLKQIQPKQRKSKNSGTRE